MTSVTSGNPDALELLDRALAQAGGVIAGVGIEQAELPTPCPAFDVRKLVNHTVYDVQTFASMVRGGERGSADADLIGNDWAGSYQLAAQQLQFAWREKGIEGTVKNQLGEFPASWAAMQHVADLAVHAWDIAVATRQPTTGFDDRVAEASLAWARQNLKPAFRGPDKSFGAEVPVPEGAPAYDRLVGFFGRLPGYPAPA
jgi:uncharacterized protein (TIGR03086 family)